MDILDNSDNSNDTFSTKSSNCISGFINTSDGNVNNYNTLKEYKDIMNEICGGCYKIHNISRCEYLGVVGQVLCWQLLLYCGYKAVSSFM